MDFVLVLGRLLEGFDRLGIRYAAIGGLALGAWGAERTTQDVDFLVHREDLEKLHGLMTALGYRRIFHSENVSQYQGENDLWGFADFLHAFRPLAVRMIREAGEKPFSGATPRKLRVARPEDIVGLKVQALANNPARKARETADIEALVRANLESLDWSRMEEYYRVFGLEEDFKLLREHLNDA